MEMDATPWFTAKNVAETYLSILNNPSNGKAVFLEKYLPD
jgi:hypothetical protein